MKGFYRVLSFIMMLLVLSVSFLACARTSAEDEVKAQETTDA